MSLVMDKTQIEAFLQRDFAQVAQDFSVHSLSEQGLELRLHVAERHLRPGGTVSGPTIFGLADIAFYLAILSRIGPVALAVTTNASIDFMRKPPAGGDLVAQARILKLGRALVVGDVLVRGIDAPAVLARASMTYSVPPKA